MFRPSWRRWLPWWSGASRGPRRKQPGGKRFRPAVQVLEDRTVLSDFQWVNPGSGLFNNANNWRDSANVAGVPGLNDPNDTASILINGITVTSSEDHTIRSLTAPQATLQATAGTFKVNSNSKVGGLNLASGATFDVGAGNVSTSISLLGLNGGTLEVDKGNVTLTGGLSTGGTFAVAAGATLFLDNGGTFGGTYNGTGVAGAGVGAVQLTSGSITLGGGGATFNFVPKLFQWTGGTILGGGGTLTNATTGFITVGSSSSDQRLLNGTFANRGTITLAEAGGHTLILQNAFDNQPGGILQGSGTITGGVFNSGGTVSPGVPPPGLSPDIVTIMGNYTQGSSGVYNVEIGGTNALPPPAYDQLFVTGVATLDGTLNVTLINGFSPAAGNTFTILTGNPVMKTFAITNLPALKPGLAWKVQYNVTSVVLMTAVQAPIVLASSGVIVHAVQGTGLNGVSVASVVDASGPQPPGSYAVVINWGDGSSAGTGSVVLHGAGLVVQGNHTYTVEGNYVVTVSVTRGGTTTTTQSTASVFGYVTSLYEVLLGREPDNGGLSYWVGRQQAGTPRQVIANFFWACAEHVGVEVDQLYAALLGHPADAGGRAYWVQRVVAGMNLTDVVIGFLTSPEYTASHFAPLAYVNGLYNGVLGRPADGGIFTLAQMLQSGAVSRATLATAFLTSDESYVSALSEYYREFLGRPLDPFAFQIWMSPAVRRQATPLSVTGLVLGSDEYLGHQFALARQRLTS